jgi:hypothetical protein
MRLIGFAIYLGVGAMLHAMFVGAHFDWSSAWTFGWLFGWPIMLFISFGTIILLTVFGCFIGYVAWTWLETIATWRERRRNARKAKA